MVQFLNLAVAKIVCLGFLCGLIGSWFLTSTTNRMLDKHHLSTTPLKLEEETILDAQQFMEHSGHHEGETLLVDKLAKDMPIFAFIFTSKSHKDSHSVHIKSTWAKRFTKYLFFSDVEDADLPAVTLPQTKGWEMTRSALIYVHDNFLQAFSFFMKASDHNYVVVENLRALLQQMDPKEPLLIGRQTTGDQDGSQFISDESGYVMSHAALEKIVTGIKGDVEACQKGDGPVNVKLGKCATAVGVKLFHAVDPSKSDYFHPLSPSQIINKFVQTMNPNETLYGPIQMFQGIGCCSDRSVTFSNIKGTQFYLMEYMIYHIYPYGIIRDPQNYQKLTSLIATKEQQ